MTMSMFMSTICKYTVMLVNVDGYKLIDILILIFYAELDVILELFIKKIRKITR